jgi:YegS/Rv2252/BmrU family lipid kinase
MRGVDDVLVFANPIAGRGRARVAAGRIVRALHRAGLRVHVFVERPPEIAAERLACVAGARAVVAIGGDGTLRAVVDRLLACQGPGARVPPILVVPFGTANLMGRHLGLKWDDEAIDRQVLDAIERGEIVQLDAARANGRLFLLMAGVGIDAQVVHVLDQMRDGPIDITSYVIPAALAFQAYQYPKLTVHVDGRRAFGPRPGVAFVGNVAEYGTGFPILPHARTDDGLLDVCAMPCESRKDVLRLLLHAAAGEHLRLEDVVYIKGKRIRIDSAEPVPVQIDGEAADFTPISIDLLPHRLPFIVPATS